MSVIGVPGSVYAANEEANIIGPSSGIGVSAKATTADQQFTSKEAIDGDLGEAGSSFYDIEHPGKKLFYCQATADVAPGDPVILHEGVGYRNMTGSIWPKHAWGFAVEP